MNVWSGGCDVCVLKNRIFVCWHLLVCWYHFIAAASWHLLFTFYYWVSFVDSEFGQNGIGEKKNNSREMENETAFDLLFHSFARPAGRTLGLLVGQSVIQSVDCHCETCSDHGRVASTWTTLSRSLFQVLPQIHPSPSTSSSSVFCFFFSFCSWFLFLLFLFMKPPIEKWE